MVGSASTLVTHIVMAEARAYRVKVVLRSFWELESLGILEENESLYEKFKSNISFNGERYEVILPWQDRATKMPDYYMLNHSRLNGLMHRLRKWQKFLKSMTMQSRNRL